LSPAHFHRSRSYGLPAPATRKRLGNQQKTGPTAKNGLHLEKGSHHWGQKRILKAKTKAL
jgi:hypothetical protein